MIHLFSFSISPVELIMIVLVALFTGMAKTGVHGAGMISVPMLAAVFGGQLSSGILLPMLVMADVFGVHYYHRHASWPHLKKVFPWAALGVALGTVAGNYLNNEQYKLFMGVIIVVSIFILIWLEQGHRKDIPDYRWFAILTGVAGGFTSMVGNLAGSVMAVYLLAMRLPKNEFIGTAAWFFMVVNVFKVPFHVFAWHTITLNTLLFDLLMLPAIALGSYLGVIIIRKFSERTYRWFIIGMTILAAVYMYISN